MLAGRVNIVMDGQWGSTGKGKLCYYLAEKHDVRVAVCDFQTNAGHTVVLDNGDRFVFQQLPVASIKKDVQLLINPGATITVSKLLQEIEMIGAQNRLVIHPHACIVTEKCKTMEAEYLKRIASTLKGCGAATGMKAMRHPDTVLAKDVPELSRWIGNTSEVLLSACTTGRMILGEAAQGWDLSLNHGLEYPFVTSRDINPAAFMSNAGIPLRFLGHVFGCLRTYPIRVGNHIEAGTLLGSSGPYYGDQEEVDWERIKYLSGAEVDQTEKTTVTQKVRRVFTFSNQQVKGFVRACWPDFIFLNFLNHLDASIVDIKDPQAFPAHVKDWISELNGDLASAAMDMLHFGVEPPFVKYVGTGPKNSDIVELT